jgi:hypothetical protein
MSATLRPTAARLHAVTDAEQLGRTEEDDAAFGAEPPAAGWDSEVVVAAVLVGCVAVVLILTIVAAVTLGFDAPFRSGSTRVPIRQRLTVLTQAGGPFPAVLVLGAVMLAARRPARHAAWLLRAAVVDAAVVGIIAVVGTINDWDAPRSAYSRSGLFFVSLGTRISAVALAVTAVWLATVSLRSLRPSDTADDVGAARQEAAYLDG